jgi:hypothetical protein
MDSDLSCRDSSSRSVATGWTSCWTTGIREGGREGRERWPLCPNVDNLLGLALDPNNTIGSGMQWVVCVSGGRFAQGKPPDSIRIPRITDFEPKPPAPHGMEGKGHQVAQYTTSALSHHTLQAGSAGIPAIGNLPGVEVVYCTVVGGS